MPFSSGHPCKDYQSSYAAAPPLRPFSYTRQYGRQEGPLELQQYELLRVF